MQIKLFPAQKNERVIVKNLSQYYIYDMSEFTGWSPSELGLYSLDDIIIEQYWNEKDHWPFLIKCNGEIAGFSLLRKHHMHSEFMDIGLFYVLRKFKGKGIGREAFKQSASMFPGKWLIRVLLGNDAALAFWKRVINDLTSGEYHLAIESNGRNKMHFFRFEITDASCS